MKKKKQFHLCNYNHTKDFTVNTAMSVKDHTPTSTYLYEQTPI